MIVDLTEIRPYILRMNSGEYATYIWQQADWPNWVIDYAKLAALLAEVHLERGKLLGAMQGLGFDTAERATLEILIADVIKSSEIEGDQLNPKAVRSSLARKLGLEVAGLAIDTKPVDGVVEMVLDATRHYADALTRERLFAWHAALFPTGYSGLSKITVAQYRDDRDGAMQVVSGGVGHESVHFEAPPAAHLQAEMQRFLTWFNANDHSDPLIKAGIAHLWFVTLHPFEDGNGRIGRAVCDMALAKADASVQRFYSLSAQIQHERHDYYEYLERAQKSTSDITEWLTWFLGCLLRAIKGSGEVLQSTLYSASLWKQWEGTPMNPRQVLMLKKLLHHFEGKLTSSKWAKIAKTSPDTALRDIKDLLAKGVLVEAESGGRSTHYLLKIDELKIGGISID